MIRFSIAAAMIGLLAFSGCGEDRSHPAGVDDNGNPIVYKSPTAVIELNATTHQLSRGEYVVDRVDTGNPFIFDGSASHDNDENNQSIVDYQWTISHSFIDACVDINITGQKAIFKFIHVDANESNQTCYNEATDNGEINASLTVKDNEGKSASTTKSIKTN